MVIAAKVITAARLYTGWRSGTAVTARAQKVTAGAAALQSPNYRHRLAQVIQEVADVNVVWGVNLSEMAEETCVRLKMLRQ